jgi:hypothetical protein
MPPKRKTLKRGRTTVKTFRQENDYYCGPATAKMTLRWLGVTRSQDQLWDAIQDEADAQGLPRCEACPPVECSPWYTPPEALAAVIAGMGQAPVKVVSERQVAATDHAIVWSVVNDIPAVALVYGWAHWLVVHGYRVDREPTSMQDVNYELLGLHVIDPWPKTKARVFIDAAQWRSDYLTGVVCGRFAGAFVAVCDPDPDRPTGGPTVRPRRIAKMAARGGKAPAGGGMVSAARARKGALDGLQRADLLKDEVWRAAMLRAAPGVPEVVHRLDRPRTFYMRVPFGKGPSVTAEVLVDAYSAEMLTARAAEDVDRPMPPMISAEDAIARVAERRYDLPGQRPQLRVRREGLFAAPTLVWKPCRESLSPFVPFRHVVYGNLSFYVRADGEVFTALTEAPPGG